MHSHTFSVKRAFFSNTKKVMTDLSPVQLKGRSYKELWDVKLIKTCAGLTHSNKGDL